MKGFWKMLTGQGTKEYREEHQQLIDEIPETFPSHYTDGQRAAKHPAYTGKHSGSLFASGIRRANTCRGPLSKVEERRFTQLQRLTAEYEREVKSLPSGAEIVPFNEWMAERLR